MSKRLYFAGLPFLVVMLTAWLVSAPEAKA
jgi:hypothetical protein